MNTTGEIVMQFAFALCLLFAAQLEPARHEAGLVFSFNTQHNQGSFIRLTAGMIASTLT